MPEPPRLDHVLVAAAQHVGTVTLNRPDQRNPLSAGMIADLRTALAWCRDQPDVRVVVLTGAGDKAFCAGADLGSFSADVPELVRHHQRHGFDTGVAGWRKSGGPGVRAIPSHGSVCAGAASVPLVRGAAW